MNRFPKALIFSVLAALIFLPQLGETCGPFFNEAIFTRTHGPDRTMADFARGRIGVVLPDWYTAYRVVAYRYLESKPLSAAEQQSLLEHYDVDRRIEPPSITGSTALDWMTVRAQYPQPPIPTAPGKFRQSKNGFEEYPNCLDSAFITAAATLQDRARRFGASSPELEEWIRGQDAVFGNCAGGPNIPTELPVSANTVLRADRAYQIAAAHFYSGTTKGYEIALQDFQAITEDKDSSWQTIAPYLIARTLIRQASATAAENRTHNPVYLAKAEVQLQAILKDPTQQSIHAAAESLLGFVRFYLHPEQRETELGNRLAGGGPNPHFAQDLIDYTWLKDRSPDLAKDDLSTWLRGGTLDGAIGKWRATGSLAWLVAVLRQVHPGDRAFREVMEAAARVPRTSPAYATVAYYRVRLAMQCENNELARQILQAALAHGKALPPSAVHLFQDEQLQVATDFGSFESRLWQRPIGYDDNMGGIEPCEKPDCAPLFTPLAATLLNTRVPADVFARIAMSGTLPANLNSRMAPAAWARAVLLDQSSLAKQMAEAAGAAQPALQPYLKQYEQAQTPEERQFAAAFAILHFPGLRPSVDAAYPRTTAFQKIDNYRDNWWCEDMGNLAGDVNWIKNYDDDQAQSVQKKPALPFPGFLEAAERQRAASEWKRLSSYETAARALPRIAIDWARKRPEDARVPEALHLAVRATRYGCEDGKPNPLSREAFTLLHQNYPKSEWTKKTPFWFK